MHSLKRRLRFFTFIALAGALAHGAESTDSKGPLAATLQAAVDHHIVTGLVALVADKDKVLDLEAVGVSNLSTKAPMKTNSQFWIASMTKSFTAAAFMMLVDEGKASLSDP